MRTPLCCAVLVAVANPHSFTAQNSSIQDRQSVSIVVPPSIPSETLQMFYFLSGPFGGDGGYIQPQSNLRSYEIVTSRFGKAATDIKILAYAPGCKIQRI